jgi:hypothetical protein
MSGDRIGKRDQQRVQRSMGGRITRSDLGLEECREQEGMIGQLDDLNRPIAGIPADDQPGRLQEMNQILIRAVPAEVIAKHRLLTADGAGPRSGNRVDHTALADQRAGKRHDDCRPAGLDLCVSGIGDPGDAPGVLHEHVLEAASGAEEGDARLACQSNRTQSSLETSIRAPGRHPHTVDISKPGGRIGKLVGRGPLHRDAVR